MRFQHIGYIQYSFAFALLGTQSPEKDVFVEGEDCWSLYSFRKSFGPYSPGSPGGQNKIRCSEKEKPFPSDPGGLPSLPLWGSLSVWSFGSHFSWCVLLWTFVSVLFLVLPERKETLHHNNLLGLTPLRSLIPLVKEECNKGAQFIMPVCTAPQLKADQTHRTDPKPISTADKICMGLWWELPAGPKWYVSAYKYFSIETFRETLGRAYPPSLATFRSAGSLLCQSFAWHGHIYTQYGKSVSIKGDGLSLPISGSIETWNSVFASVVQRGNTM